MRIRTAVPVIVLVLLLAAPVLAGQARLDRVSAPSDGKVLCDLQLVNDSGKSDRFKVSARVICDKADGKGITKGKKLKFSIRLAAGEILDEEFELKMPKKGGENVRVECKVLWKKGRAEMDRRSLMAGGDDERDGMHGGDGVDHPSDRPVDWPGPMPGGEPVELSGTLVLSEVEVDFPRPMMEGAGDKDWPDDFLHHQLSIETEDGETWVLIGGEAEYVTKLMLKAELTETTAEITGVPLMVEIYDEPQNPGKPDHPGKPPADFFDKGQGYSGGKHGKGLTFGPDGMGKMMFLLKWDAKGIEDTRPKFIHHRFVLFGPLCKIGEAAEKIVTSEDDWKTLLTDAGIRLPEPKDLPEKDLPEKDLPKKLDAGWDAMGGMWDDDWGQGEFKGIPWRVDFEKEMVIALFAGEQLSTGYKVVVLGVVEEEDVLVVKYAIHEPTKYEVVIDVPTTPFAIIAIRATDASISFELVSLMDKK